MAQAAEEMEHHGRAGGGLQMFGLQPMRAEPGDNEDTAVPPLLSKVIVYKVAAFVVNAFEVFGVAEYKPS